MSTPVVVQGKPVGNVSAPNNSWGVAGPSNQLQESDKQETSCNDPLFAVLFYGCVIAILAIAALYGPDAMEGGEGGGSSFDYTGLIITAVIVVIISFFVAGGGLLVMMCIPEFLIKTSLIFVTVMSGISAVMAFATGNIAGGVIGALFFMFSVWYAYAVWSRIPFASINLVTGCTAIRKHIGVVAFAYIFAILAGGWSVAWSLAFAGLFDKTYECEDVNGQQVCDGPNYGILFGLFLAFFFGHQVIQNSIHVIIAGTVGTWWFEPDNANPGCCDSAVIGSFVRTTTTSFGSICFGSLLVAILQALRALANQARQGGGNAEILACIAECILNCLANILEYFNKWAFIYVGLYGMPYLKAGKSVFELFQNRGWDAIIADDLIGNTLFLVSFVVGLIVGAIAVVLEVASGLLDDIGGNKLLIAFILGLVIGLMITSILMSVVASSVNAVIVLFAEAPTEFQENHPDLSGKMREIWSQVYLGSV
jgi:hypothetical protein